MPLEVTIAELIFYVQEKHIEIKHDKPMSKICYMGHFYQHYPTHKGFRQNKFNQCISNKTINCKQCIIIWHVDGLKKSHINQKVNKDNFEQFSENFGK